tara:strand:+ start:14016 stop:14885 length:870 start_codon:yes stop_codon:yes gene_type:complete
VKKINIGAGNLWKSDGWETLDNAPTSYPNKWQHYGKCWDTKLNSNFYDIVFTSHTLEHVPQFRVERTISEINRIMKVGGTLRILVPDLEASAKAYLKKDKKFFKFSKHYNDKLGIAGNFLRQIVSPGGQTIAINRDFDEIFGGYAHLFCFDYEIIKILLEKWGFGDIKRCRPGKSSLREMREFQCYVINNKKYDISDPTLQRSRKIKKTNGFYITGFDKKWSGQLVVEAKKIKTVRFSENEEFSTLKQVRYNSKIDNIKIKILFVVSIMIDTLYKNYLILKKLLKKNRG